MRNFQRATFSVALVFEYTALFREGDRWATYVVAEGRARRPPVDIGHQTGQETEVMSGLTDGTRVILHPGDTLKNGVRVAERRMP